VPSLDSNSGLPYSKPAHYQLGHAAPKDKVILPGDEVLIVLDGLQERPVSGQLLEVHLHALHVVDGKMEAWKKVENNRVNWNVFTNPFRR
jgi:hypothetical protein